MKTIKKIFITGAMALLLVVSFGSLAHAQVSNCSATITTQDQWDDCCDNAGASNQAPVAACNAFANNVNSTCSASITNQIQYDDCCGNGGGTGQASTSSCNAYETANGMPAGDDGCSAGGALTGAGSGTCQSGSQSGGALLGNSGLPGNTAANNVNQPLNIHLSNPLSVSTIGDAVNLFLGVIIKIALPLIVLFFIWSGLTFIFARGNPTEVAKAKQMFLYTVIGTLLILGAWVITNAIIGTVNSIL
jgi:hypothetical protein